MPEVAWMFGEDNCEMNFSTGLFPQRRGVLLYLADLAGGVPSEAGLDPGRGLLLRGA